MRIYDLTCNGCAAPNQVDSKKVFFGWKLSSEIPGERQTAYQIQIYQNSQVVWRSGKVFSEKSQYVSCGGVILEEDQSYTWSVAVWNEKEEYCQSEKAQFETGLNKWRANWIGYDKEVGEPFDPQKPFYCADDFNKGKNELYLPPVPYLRKEIQIDFPVKKAKIYVSAFGVVKTLINGKTAGEEYLVPGLSNYKTQVYCKAWDVTELIQEGINTIGILLADGWYAGYMGLNNREWYGSRPRAMIQLSITYQNDEKQYFGTDKEWKAAYGAILEADIFQGEKHDGRKELRGWAKNGYDDQDWEYVQVGAENDITPVPHCGEPIVAHSIIEPKKEYVDSKFIKLDFPEYVCGVIKFIVTGTSGSRFVIRHAEMRNPDGSLWTEGNRSARCQDEYILNGEGEEVFFPEFTHHGFRCADIQIEGTIEFHKIEGVQIGSALREKTQFKCDNKVINQVFDMVRATQKANMLDVPTDCSARDERLGWGLEGNHFMYAMSYIKNIWQMLFSHQNDIQV